ncbi:DUF2207 domain-containing protein [Luteimonas sp. SDU101]|uniref:DUF2207 domain-containing protein n=1 Tax=Luteimonas sp. SDU101 TaxID=3422593 RepID=UPI003EBEBDE3
MSGLFRLACACLLLAACALPLRAAERISAYDIDVLVNPDGSLEVTERIRVRAEGDRIRRGLYRDFPTRYRDRHGNRMLVGFEVLEVLRDGRPEPWFTERRGNGVRVNTGSDALLPVPATYDYSLRYRTTRQLGFFDDHDELYWNAIGGGWEFPIDAGRVEVRLPQPVPASRMSLDGWAGAQGERSQRHVASIPAPGLVRWRLTAPLPPGEGFTVRLSFPKGVVAQPGQAQRLGWLLRDNSPLLVALLGLLVVAGYCGLRWHQVGRDPPAGVVIARYHPPEGISPAGLRFIRRMGYDTRCFSADVLALAVAGAVRIERDKGLLSDHWRLERSGPAPAGDEAALMRLFASHAAVDLDKDNATLLQSATSEHRKALDRRYRGTMFHNNSGSSLVALLLMVLFCGAAIALAAATGGGLLFAAVPMLAMLATVIAFAFLVRAPTQDGRRVLDHIEGLRRYLGVAEKQDLQRLQGPSPDGPDAAEPALDATRFEALLPYAVALDVEDAWTRKFTLAVGAAAAAAATASIGWYHGSNGTGSIGDIGSFTKAVGGSLAAQIASSSSPPGSSSGGGGGGFSGGGGGGGGGGGR